MTSPPRPARNRLRSAASPYLLQHASNPVDWFPWGPEAIEEARRRDVPIFLSIGYSTCYWCHVMERESFESPFIASILNDLFVAIKVDREERPDIDDIYMTATQILTGHGGWPMSVFLEPRELRPFWCGTYFPPESRPSMRVPAFPDVLRNISRAWTTQRDDVLRQAEQIAQIVRERSAATPDPAPFSGLHIVSEAIAGLLRSFDQTHAGFGGAPKFPQPLFLELLLQALPFAADVTRPGIERALRATLDRMMIGGLFDQIGGGFHRYCVDAHWTVPHFEKMLYDNALLASLYARASVALGEAEYALVARRTLEYVRREMRLESGLFASAQDAEVDAREGLNYLWTAQELQAALSPDDASLALRMWMVDRGPNFRDPHHPDEPPRSVLRLSDIPARVAPGLGLDEAQFCERREAIARRLLEIRASRRQPHRDDKAITCWNAMMIDAYAAAAGALKDAALLQHALDAADALLQHLQTAPGELIRTRFHQTPGGPAFLEDYAAAILAMERVAAVARALGRTDDAPRFEAASDRFMKHAADRFRDLQGAWYDTATSDLFVRTRSLHDGAIPCATSLMLHALLERAARDQAASPAIDAAVHDLLCAIAGPVRDMPLSMTNVVRALLTIQTRAEWNATRSRALVQGPAPEPSASNPADDFTPVEIYAEHERLTVSRSTPASTRVALRIAPGHHVLAADPWIDDPAGSVRGMIPLRVSVVGGTGVAAYAEYPPGAPLATAPDVLGRPRVYEGEIDFEIAVERQGDWSGKPLLAVTFHACTDTECLAPRTVELDIAIDRAD